MKKFYTIIIVIAALLIVQMLVTTKAYGETRSGLKHFAWEEAVAFVEDNTSYNGYTEQTFTNAKVYFTDCLNVTKDKARVMADGLEYYRIEKGQDTMVILYPDRCYTITLNKDGTLTERRWVVCEKE